MVTGWLCRKAFLEEKTYAPLQYPAKLCAARFDDKVLEFPKAWA